MRPTFEAYAEGKIEWAVSLWEGHDWSWRMVGGRILLQSKLSLCREFMVHGNNAFSFRWTNISQLNYINYLKIHNEQIAVTAVTDTLNGQSPLFK